MCKLIQVGVIDGKKHEQSARVYSEEGLCPTLMAGSRKTCTGGYITPKILVGSNDVLLNNTYKLIKLEKESYNMEKLRVFEAFCGYGSQSVALDNIGVPHEVVAISDIDADVLISYGAIRGDITQEVDKTDDEIKEWLMARNIGWDFQKQKSSITRMKKDKLHKLYNSCVQHNCLGDVSIIDPNTIPDHDLFTYSFPCTDISVAGKQAGLSKDSGTRSGLLWECEKIIATKKPKYLLMENVKNLVGKKFKDEFDVWCDWLSEQGYKNFYQVLNAKDYGIPQNRERVFMISILDENATYEFPPKMPLELRLKDVLQDNVEDKYYIDNDASNRLLKALEEKGYTKNMTGVANNPDSREFHDFKECRTTLCARDYKDPKIVQIEAEKDILVYDDYNECIKADQSTINTLLTKHCPHYNSRIIEIEEKTNELNMVGMLDIKGNEQIRRVYGGDGISPTLNTMQGGNRQPKIVDDFYKNRPLREYDETSPALRSERYGLKVDESYRIRKLTPMECFRLMGMKDEHFNRCVEVGLSNSALYKQAGNSIVVDVLEYIFRELFKEYITTENFTQPQEN